jgi:hypothetical protein
MIKDIIMLLREKPTGSVTNRIPQVELGFSAEFLQGNHQKFSDDPEAADLPFRPMWSRVLVPAVIADAGSQAKQRFFEFFTATIRNRNTRRAYARSVGRFFAWCNDRGIGLREIRPVVVAGYLEQHGGAKPSVKVSLGKRCQDCSVENPT